jgi:hypothetical protein
MWVQLPLGLTPLFQPLRKVEPNFPQMVFSPLFPKVEVFITANQPNFILKSQIEDRIPIASVAQ